MSDDDDDKSNTIIINNASVTVFISDRAVAVAGPRAWNSLMAKLRFIRTFYVLNVI